jgi:hypothetical protein
MGTEYSFYVKDPVTVGEIVGRVGASGYWPVFETKSQVITTTAQSIQISCTASCGLNATRRDGSIITEGWENGTSDKFGVTLSNNSVQIPPCLSPLIELGDNVEITVSALANVTQTHSDVGTISSIALKSGTAFGKVYPSSISATPRTDIPKGGKYVVDASVQPYKWGYSYVKVQVVDASIFASQ